MAIPGFEEEELLVSYICKLFYVVFLHIWSTKHSHEIGAMDIGMAVIFLLRKTILIYKKWFWKNKTLIVVVQQRNSGAIILFAQSFYFFLMAGLKWLPGVFWSHSLSAFSPHLPCGASNNPWFFYIPRQISVFLTQLLFEHFLNMCYCTSHMQYFLNYY